MDKVTLKIIADQLSIMKETGSELLKHAKNGVDISRAISTFNDELFTPLRKDVLKFLLQQDEPFITKKALFSLVERTGKDILNEHAQNQADAEIEPEDGDQAEIDAQADAENEYEHDDPEEEVDQGDELFDLMMDGVEELNDLVSGILLKDQKISLEDINQIHSQYFDSQSLSSMMNELDTLAITESDAYVGVVERLWAQKEKLQPDQRQDHDAISIADNQGQHETVANQDIVSQQTVERQAMVKIIFRHLSYLGSRLTKRVSALLNAGLDVQLSPELLKKLQEAIIKSYLLQLELCNELNDMSMIIENERVGLNVGGQSLDITDTIEWISQQKRTLNPDSVGSSVKYVQSQEVSIEKKEKYLSKYDEYLVFLSKKDREKLSPNFVKQALQKNKINGLLLSDTILKLGPVFIDSLFAKDNGIEEVNLTPQCAEKMLMLKGLSERTRAQLRLKLPTWKKLEVENVVAYLKSEYCHNEDPELTDLKKALGETIVKAALENNQLSDSGRMRHISSLFPMLTESECAEMIFPKEWNDNIEGTEGQDADHELIGSLYLCGLAGWKPKITRTNTGNGTMTSYAIANDDGESSFQQIQGQKNSQSDDEKSEQDSNQTVDSMVKNPTDRLNFLSLMKSKGIKQIASSITEKRDLSTKVIIDFFDKGLAYDNLSEEQLKQGNPLSHASGFLGSQDWQQLRATQKELEQEQKDALGEQNENNPDQERTEENSDNIEPGSSGGLRK